MSAPRRAALVVLSVLVLGHPADAGTPVAKAPITDAVLPTPDYLPPLARQLLHKRMQRHGKDQSRLVLAVTLLQRDVVKALATDIAEEPRIVRPIAEGRDDLNAALPERFFVLQDALRLRAKDLANAASGKDDLALAQSLGQLVETCVSCHSVFLNAGQASR